MAGCSTTANAVRFSCCGVRIAVEFDSFIPPSEIQSIQPPDSSELEGEDAEHHFSILRWSSERGEEDHPKYLVRKASRRVASPECLGPSLTALRKEIHLCVAEYAQDRVFVHAGVAAWNGQAIVCPGRSRAGKSTLIWSMLNSGATYYSDEYAVFDRNGHIHPFPLPVSLRGPVGQSRSVAADRIGIEPLSSSLILFAQYRKNRKWEPSVLTPGQTVLRLVRNSPAMRRNPVTVLAVLKNVALASRAYAGNRGEVNTIVDWLKSLDI